MVQPWLRISSCSAPGSRVGLITTLGFRDVLEIQRSYRSEPLDILWKKPGPLVSRDLRYEIDERTLA